ncbi:hypothetical protein D3C80_2043770 [compost metagenome]
MRVLGRGKAVEEPGIDLGIQLWQLFQHIADDQRQAYPALVEDEGLEAVMHCHVVRQ